MRKAKLRPDVVAEPLIDQWYAWSYLVPPAPHARYLTDSQLPIMESFAENPQVHVDALKDPEMAGGPFIQYGPERRDEIAALLERTKQEQKHLLLLSEAIGQLERILSAHPKGESLEPLYPIIPTALQGFVELVYDARDSASIRFIEGMLYRSEYYQPKGQAIGLRRVDDVDKRKFVLSTPSLREDLESFLELPFNDPRIDRLFQTRDIADNPNEIAESFGLTNGARDSFLSLFTEEALPQAKRYDGEGMRIRYIGHACVLVESSEVSVIVDPLVSNPNPGGIDRYSYADLPESIDYAMMTHNHQDHVMFETLFQLRHKIKNVVIPSGQKGSLLDPSLRMTLERIGFQNIIEIDELGTIPVPGGEIVSLPFHGEHGDLNIATKSAWWIQLHGRSVICAADSNNIDNALYQNLRHLLGSPDVLYIGMECEGAPYTWNYGALLPGNVKRQNAQSRRLDGSDCKRALELVETMAPAEVYIYAMGLEPWLTYITSIVYSDDDAAMIESSRFMKECQARGIPCERPYAQKETILSPRESAPRSAIRLSVPEGAYGYQMPELSEAKVERATGTEVEHDPEAEALTELLNRLRELNIRLSLNGEELKCNAPKGALTPELTSEIKSRKPAIIELLKGASEPTS
ncbi:MAG: polyketide synthase [Verrucomicrobiales bacterium]|nr:polyketide synthase [Verrucomicrobiales bacterium]|tara:strand:- start:87 stop:1991 length:1905 start_codon:yes stop_codon:yes gene_type:complete